MNRRAFLARVPAAVAALPFLGGLTALAGASEPEVQGTLLEAEAIPPLQAISSMNIPDGASLTITGQYFDGVTDLTPQLRQIQDLFDAGVRDIVIKGELVLPEVARLLGR